MIRRRMGWRPGRWSGGGGSPRRNSADLIQPMECGGNAALGRAGGASAVSEQLRAALVAFQERPAAGVRIVGPGLGHPQRALAGRLQADAVADLDGQDLDLV